MIRFLSAPYLHHRTRSDLSDQDFPMASPVEEVCMQRSVLKFNFQNIDNLYFLFLSVMNFVCTILRSFQNVLTLEQKFSYGTLSLQNFNLIN